MERDCFSKERPITKKRYYDDNNLKLTDDSVGNRTSVLDAQGDTLNVLRYNLLNLPEEYVKAGGGTVNYVYSADGEKLYVEENPSGGTVQDTEYAANYRIEKLRLH